MLISTGGLPASEVTLAQTLKDAGYATGIIGKWHLGVWANNQPQHHPLAHGFDFHFGLMHSNDMNPSDKPKPPRANALVVQDPEWWNAALYRGRELLEPRTDQTQLSKRYAEEATKFIGANKDKPFFLYMPHTFPHTPLFASERFKGKSSRGIYGDVLAELDWNVGEVLKALKANGVADNTLVFFTSDNGPWTLMGTETGGSAGLLKDGKGSTWEGGMRVPGIAWWPGKIKPGVTDNVGTMLDLFPTAAKLAGAKIPNRTVRWTAPTFRRSCSRNAPSTAGSSATTAARSSTPLASATGRSTSSPKAPTLTLSRPSTRSRSSSTSPSTPPKPTRSPPTHPDVVARLAAAVEQHRATVVPVRSQLIDVVAK